MGLTRTSLEGLSRRVADMGITAVTPTELTALTDTGSAVGVSPVLLGVLTDSDATEVTRERAFSLVACAVSGAVRSEHALAA
jgi:hypothetical protein